VPARLKIDESEWLDDVVDEIVTTRCVDISKPVPHDALLRREGRPVAESVADRALTSQAIFDQEQALIDWVDRRLTRDSRENPDSVIGSSKELDVAQTAAAGAVAGDADIVLVVGPAGTGKTTALAPAVAQIKAAGRIVFGVAPSATAAEVLAEETGVAADTLDILLIEHRLTRPPGTRFDLPAGATVIVDEAGMLPTAKLAELARLADVRNGESRWSATHCSSLLSDEEACSGFSSTHSARSSSNASIDSTTSGSETPACGYGAATSPSPTSTNNTDDSTAAP